MHTDLQLQANVTVSQNETIKDDLTLFRLSVGLKM